MIKERTSLILNIQPHLESLLKLVYKLLQQHCHYCAPLRWVENAMGVHQIRGIIVVFGGSIKYIKMCLQH